MLTFCIITLAIWIYKVLNHRHWIKGIEYDITNGNNGDTAETEVVDTLGRVDIIRTVEVAVAQKVKREGEEGHNHLQQSM